MAISMKNRKRSRLQRILGLSLALSIPLFSAGVFGLGQPQNLLTGYGKAEAYSRYSWSKYFTPRYTPTTTTPTTTTPTTTTPTTTTPTTTTPTTTTPTTTTPTTTTGTVVDVRNFGATGNGTTNDTAAIQAAINSLPTAGGTVVIPAGTYAIDALKTIQLKNNVTLQMTPSTILQVIPNASDLYAVLNLGGVSNVKVNSGILLGDRYTHKATGGESGFGVAILGSDQVTVTGTAANNMWGDGFIIDDGPGWGDSTKHSTNIQLVDISADNNRRQGISVISGQNISIIRPKLTNTNGTAPQAGIDVEPNDPTDVLQNIVITDAVTSGNLGSGISLSLGALVGTTTPISITVNNHQDNGSNIGLDVSGGLGAIPGKVEINNSTWTNSKTNGLQIVGVDYRGFSTTVNNSTVVNAGNSQGMAIYNYDSTVLGNVHINNPTITRTSGNMTGAFYVASNKAVQNITIVQPILNGVSMGSITSGVSVTK